LEHYSLPVIRPESLNNNIELRKIFNRKDIDSYVFIKDIFEIKISNEIIQKFDSLNNINIFLNTVNLKCSNRLIYIITQLVNSQHSNKKRLVIGFDNFVKLVNVVRNITIAKFNELEISKDDLSKLKKIESLIPANSHFDYKLIRIMKSIKGKIGYKLLLIHGIAEIRNQYALLKYFKSFDNDMEHIIDACQIKALTNL
jgi:hypothetical protein